MVGIEVGMSVLAQCALQDIPTNVEAEIGNTFAAEHLGKGRATQNSK